MKYTPAILHKLPPGSCYNCTTIWNNLLSIVRTRDTFFLMASHTLDKTEFFLRWVLSSVYIKSNHKPRFLGGGGFFRNIEVNCLVWLPGRWSHCLENLQSKSEGFLLQLLPMLALLFLECGAILEWGKPPPMQPGVSGITCAAEERAALQLLPGHKGNWWKGSKKGCQHKWSVAKTTPATCARKNIKLLCKASLFSSPTVFAICGANRAKVQTKASIQGLMTKKVNENCRIMLRHASLNTGERVMQPLAT